MGVPYSDTLAASGGLPPYVWSIPTGVLPGGLSLVGATGVISGTPTTNETQNFTLRVTDSSAKVANKSCSMHIFAAIAITTACPLPNGQAGTAYDQQFVASGGSGTQVWTITAGTLPAGLTMDGSGHITGMPTTNAVSTFTVHVQDSLGGVDSKSCQITITPACFDFADDFNRANGALGSPWSWISETTGHQADIVSGQFAASALGTAEITTAPDTNTTGYAEVTWTGYTSIAWGGPMVLRKTSGINNDRYVLAGQDLGGPEPRGKLVLYRESGASLVALIQVSPILLSGLMGVPIRLAFEVQPTLVRLTGYVNGVQILTFDDTSSPGGTGRITSGRPGISLVVTTGLTANTWDNFSCHTCP